MKKIFFLFFALILINASTNAQCYRFGTGPLPPGTDWNTSGCSVTFTSNIGDVYAPSKCAEIHDGMGYSTYWLPKSYSNLQNENPFCLISFEYKLVDDGFYNKKYPVHPKIFITDGSGAYIWWEEMTTVDETSPWVTVNVPVLLATGLSLPSSSTGQWKISSGGTPAAKVAHFNSILLNSTKVYFEIDVLGSSEPSEIVKLDNICFECYTPPPPPIPCNADFTFQLRIDSKGIAPMNGSILPKEHHLGSSYVYSYGGMYTTTYPVSYIYTPGIYTVCFKEITPDGQVCEKCVNICVPDPTAILTPIGGGGVLSPIEEPDTVVCDPNFTFVYETNTGVTPNSGNVFLDNYHATSTYTYNWGDGLITTDPISKIYSPGNYTVCVTETRPNGTTCTACIAICVTDPTPTIFTPPFRKSNENTITGLGFLENKISIAPNPATNNTTLSLELVSKDNVKVAVIDMTGKKVLDVFNGSIEEGAQKITINTENLASGLYQVQVMIGNNMSTHKLSVVK